MLERADTMSKIAVIFPGMGYTKDRPLLYFAGKIAKSWGYELVFVEYEDVSWDKELLKDHSKMAEILKKCIDSAEKTLADIELNASEDILFISKSIGTVIAAAVAKRHSASVRQICFTPIEQFGDFIEEGNGLVFYGGSDPFANPDVIGQICRKKSLEAYRIDGANHSLEVNDVKKDIENLAFVMDKVTDKITDKSIYNFSIQNRDGSIETLSEYRGQVLLIVNTATGCGFTPQYESLERIYKTYGKDGFTILDFPCNQFGKQAPGTASEIHSFCTSRYDISFPQFAKIEVNGPAESELYSYLKSKQGFKGLGNTQDDVYLKKKLEKEVPDYESTPDIKWNFTKFLVDRRGNVVARFEPTEDMKSVEDEIVRLLK